MKTKLILLSVLIIACGARAFAQSPLKFNYQTIVRDSAGYPIPNHFGVMRLTISDTVNPGTFYQEYQNIRTNQFGYFVCWPGSGHVLSGSLSSINWASGHAQMLVELDINGTGNYIIMGTEKFASNPYALYADSAGKGGYPKHYIGEYYGGGIVFYITDNGQHGLIADSTDLQAVIDTVQWARIDTNATHAKLPGVGGGSTNTERIIINQGAGNYAAQRCANYSGGGYGDWFLPSATELSLLYLQQQIVGGFSNAAAYWSSTESTATTALATDFSNGNNNAVLKSTSNNVRAIRAF